MLKIHLCAIWVLLASTVAGSAQVTITEYPITTTPDSGPYGITSGPDGNLWFTELLANKIGRITTAGVITEFPVTTLGNLHQIITGPDGNLWFTESSGNKIGRITTEGVITEFPITTTPDSQPTGITSRPDGNLWFTEVRGNKIGRITTAGVITEFPANGFLFGITSGPDGNLWFTEFGGNIGEMTTAGVITEFPLTPFGQPLGIISGPDGNLWFAEGVGNKIGRITTAGVITEFPLTPGGQPHWITSGPDGNLWFAEYRGNKIGKVTLCAAPTITSLSAAPNVLWPPNHKMVPANVSATTEGGCGAVFCQIVSVGSNEPVEADGDWVITGDLTLNLRAERLRSGTGRIYTIMVQCTDSSGNSTTKTVIVNVAHNQGQ